MADPDVSLKLVTDGQGRVLVNVNPPADGPSARKCISAVVDVSYSMHSAANEKGDELVRYFSKLDIVKHGAFGIISSADGASLSLLALFLPGTLPLCAARLSGGEPPAPLPTIPACFSAKARSEAFIALPVDRDFICPPELPQL